MKNVAIYTTPGCIYCKMAKDWLRKNDIDYIEYDVSVNAEKREEVIKKTGQMAVPVIDVEGELVIGFDKPRLSQLLGI
ncbi:MAG TPA: NrdH-redoxin [Candidatus Campbellbacteria bacterium]|nr:NrdH-redoxin [Candidatus Campbellbacteria bacterium]